MLDRRPCTQQHAGAAWCSYAAYELRYELRMAANVPKLHGRRGPKVRSNEQRPATTFRLVLTHRERCEQSSRDLDIPLGDYLAWTVAKAHGWETVSYTHLTLPTKRIV